jgi:hypothetical protein
MAGIEDPVVLEKLEAAQNQAYKPQIAAFLVLEFCEYIKRVINCQQTLENTWREVVTQSIDTAGPWDSTALYVNTIYISECYWKPFQMLYK